MWILPLPTSFSINGPAWFVSVLWFQYMIFPYSIEYFKHAENKIFYMVIHVILTAFLSTAIFFTTLNFRLATMNLISPGFLMFHTGILCGCWCEEKTAEMKQSRSLSNKNQMKWSVYADISTSLLFSWTFLSTILQACCGIRYKASFIIQIYGTPLMIMMIISLALDGGRSRIAKICRLDALQFLGKISMSLYFVHYLLIQYFCFILQFISPKLLHLSNHKLKWIRFGSMPWWGVFITVPVSILIGYLLEQFVETPCRNLLRTKKRPHQGYNTLIENHSYGHEECSPSSITPLVASKQRQVS